MPGNPDAPFSVYPSWQWGRLMTSNGHFSDLVQVVSARLPHRRARIIPFVSGKNLVGDNRRPVDTPRLTH